VSKTATFKSWLSFNRQEAEAVAALALADYASALTAAATGTTATAAGEVPHEVANSDWSVLLLAVCDAGTAAAAAAADENASFKHNTEGAARVLLHQLNIADASASAAAAVEDSMEVDADGIK
jgi:hypothetical protein